MERRNAGRQTRASITIGSGPHVANQNMRPAPKTCTSLPLPNRACRPPLSCLPPPSTVVLVCIEIWHEFDSPATIYLSTGNQILWCRYAEWLLSCPVSGWATLHRLGHTAQPTPTRRHCAGPPHGWTLAGLPLPVPPRGAPPPLPATPQQHTMAGSQARTQQPPRQPPSGGLPDSLLPLPAAMTHRPLRTCTCLTTARARAYPRPSSRRLPR